MALNATWNYPHKRCQVQTLKCINNCRCGMMVVQMEQLSLYWSLMLEIPTAVTNGMLISSVAGAITNGIHACDSDIKCAGYWSEWSPGTTVNHGAQEISIQCTTSCWLGAMSLITYLNGNLLESAIADGSVYSRLGAAEPSLGVDIQITAATIFTTALNANGGLLPLRQTQHWLSQPMVQDVVFNTDADTNVQDYKVFQA